MMSHFLIAHPIPEVEKARTLYFQGLYATESERKLELWKLGVESIQKEEAKKDPGGILWWVANRGAIGAEKRNIVSLGIIKEVEKALKELKELDAHYGYSAADRALGSLYLEAPRFVSIGSNRLAKKHMEEALARHPDFPGNQLLQIQYLMREEEFGEAKPKIDKLLNHLKIAKLEYGDFNEEKSKWIETLTELKGKVSK